jgi:hypothetical protein
MKTYKHANGKEYEIVRKLETQPCKGCIFDDTEDYENGMCLAGQDIDCCEEIGRNTILKEIKFKKQKYLISKYDYEHGYIGEEIEDGWNVGDIAYDKYGVGIVVKSIDGSYGVDCRISDGLYNANKIIDYRDINYDSPDLWIEKLLDTFNIVEKYEKKRMTLDEIESKLGYEIELID